MKNKLIAILILCAAAFACAQSVPTIGKFVPYEHRGFYNSTSFGVTYNWFENSRDDVDKYYNRQKHEIDYYEYDGWSFSLGEFKFGVALANLVAFHTTFNIGFFAGQLDSYEEEYQDSCGLYGCLRTSDVFRDTVTADAYGFRTFFGVGATFYPFRDRNSPMNGFFVGASFGYTLFVTVGDRENTGNGGIGFELELGKEWWINEHYSIGFGLGFAHDGLVWETVKTHKSDNVLSLSFRMTRG